MDLSKHLEKAAEAVTRRNYAFAVQLYGQLLDLQPDSGEARAGLRTALFKKAEQKPPSRSLAMLAGGFNLLTAKLSATFGGHAAAAKSYERYLKLDPLHEEVNLALARALECAGCPQGALAVYRAFAEYEPRCLAASREAGRLLYESGELDAALAMYEQALKVDPRDQEALRARKNLAAEGAIKQTGVDKAKAARELAKDSEGIKRQERAARLQLTPEEIDEELDQVEQRLGAAPGDLKALLRAVELHEMRRDRQSALDCLEQALARSPEGSDLLRRAGDLRIALQRERVQQAEDRGDETAAAGARRALAEMQVVEFRARVEQNPTDLALRFELGRALLGAEQFEAAIPELQQAIKDPRHQAEALFALGRAFLGQGLGELAQTQLQKALEAADSASALRKEVLYELGAVAEQLGQRDTALDHYSRILEQDYGFRDAADRVSKLQSAS